VELPGAEGNVDERELLEHPLLHRLRPAPAHADHAGGVIALQPLGLAEVSDEPVVGLLADRARVEEDEVGLVARGGLPVAERLEHPLHALGVVLVHLAPEGRQVIGARLRLHRSRG
jgi:hypothetical protein